MRCNTGDDLLHFSFTLKISIYNQVEDLWWSLYCENSKPLSMFTKKLHFRCSAWVPNTPLLFEDSPNVLFLKYFLLQGSWNLFNLIIFLKYFFKFMKHAEHFHFHAATHVMSQEVLYHLLLHINCFLKPIKIFVVDINCYLDLVSTNYLC